jgi:hypothetical protein
VDTPGVLSGEKQRTDRGYSFVQVIHCFKCALLLSYAHLFLLRGTLFLL